MLALQRKRKAYPHFSGRHYRHLSYRLQGPAARPQAGLSAGITGNTGYYGEVESGEYLRKLKGYKGRAVYDEMRRSDPQVKAVLSAITLPIRQAEYYIQPGSESARDVKIAETIGKNLFEEMTVTWDDVVRHALLMLPFGFSILEKVWEMREGFYKLRKLDPRLPQSVIRWEYNKEKKRLNGPVQVDTDGVEYPLPIEKILVFISEREGDNWEGISILRPAYKPWYLKNDFEKINAIKHDRHGVGIPKAHVPTSVREGTREWEDTQTALESLYANERSYVIEPEGYSFDLIGGSGKAGTDTLLSIKYYDEMIARAMLAMFLNLGTTETGSRALGVSFIEIFLRALQAYADYICEIVSRFCLREYVDFNWYVKEYPLLKVQQIKEIDPQVLSTLVDSGVITPDLELENRVRSLFRLPERQEEEPPAEAKEKSGEEEKPGERSTPEKTKTRPEGDEEESAEEPEDQEESPGQESKQSEPRRVSLKEKLTPEETIPDLAGIEMKLDSAERDLATKLLRIRDDQILAIIDQIVSGRKFQNLTVPRKKEMHALCLAAFKAQIGEGREQVRQEFAFQKAKIKQSLAEPGTYREYVEIMIEELAIKIEGASNKLLSTLAASLVELKKRGISGDALRQGLRGKIGEKLSDRSWQDIVAGVVNQGWGAGRDIEIKQQANQIEYCYYSTVLDTRVCRVCLQSEGKEHKPGDPGFVTPNPDCLGGDRCRCMTIAVLSREFFDEETYEKIREGEV